MNGVRRMSIICDSIHPIYSSSKVQKTTIFYLLFLPYLPLNFISTVYYFRLLLVPCQLIFLLAIFSLLFVSCLQKSLSIICIANKSESRWGCSLGFCCFTLTLSIYSGSPLCLDSYMYLCVHVRYTQPNI